MAGQMAGRPFGSEIWWTPLEPRNHKNRSLDVDVDWAAGSAFLGGAANLWHLKKRLSGTLSGSLGRRVSFHRWVRPSLPLKKKRLSGTLSGILGSWVSFHRWVRPSLPLKKELSGTKKLAFSLIEKILPKVPLKRFFERQRWSHPSMKADPAAQSAAQSAAQTFFFSGKDGRTHR